MNSDTSHRSPVGPCFSCCSQHPWVGNLAVGPMSGVEAAHIKKNMTKPGCVPTRSRTRSRAGSWPWPRRACAGGKDEDGTASDASPNRQARCWSPPGSANRARRMCPWARSIASSWRAFTPDETTGASGSLDSNVCYPKCTDPLTLRVHLPDCHSMQRHGKYASSSFRAAFFAPDLSHVGMDL